MTTTRSVAAHIPTTIRDHMTGHPLTIDPKRSMADAHRLMREHKIRHLPVVHGGQLLGLVSLRDLALVESLPGTDPEEVAVEEAMSEDVYAVSPEAPLGIVAAEMAERKLGSAVVIQRGEVVGVFTMTDACRSLSLVLSPV
jgi:acetoin utilization protein AcuB